MWCRNVSIVPSCPCLGSFLRAFGNIFVRDKLRGRRGKIVPPVSPCFARKRDCPYAVSPGGGHVRVTVRSEAYLEELLSSEFRFEDIVVPVTPVDCVAKFVYVRDLPYEVMILQSPQPSTY